MAQTPRRKRQAKTATAPQASSSSQQSENGAREQNIPERCYDPSITRLNRRKSYYYCPNRKKHKALNNTSLSSRKRERLRKVSKQSLKVNNSALARELNCLKLVVGKLKKDRNDLLLEILQLREENATLRVYMEGNNQLPNTLLPIKESLNTALDAMVMLSDNLTNVMRLVNDPLRRSRSMVSEGRQSNSIGSQTVLESNGGSKTPGTWGAPRSENNGQNPQGRATPMVGGHPISRPMIILPRIAINGRMPTTTVEDNSEEEPDEPESDVEDEPDLEDESVADEEEENDELPPNEDMEEEPADMGGQNLMPIMEEEEEAESMSSNDNTGRDSIDTTVGEEVASSRESSQESSLESSRFINIGLNVEETPSSRSLRRSRSLLGSSSPQVDILRSKRHPAVVLSNLQNHTLVNSTTPIASGSTPTPQSSCQVDQTLQRSIGNSTPNASVHLFRTPPMVGQLASTSSRSMQAASSSSTVIGDSASSRSNAGEEQSSSPAVDPLAASARIEWQPTPMEIAKQKREAERMSHNIASFPEDPSDSFLENIGYDPLEGPSWLFESPKEKKRQHRRGISRKLSALLSNSQEGVEGNNALSVSSLDTSDIDLSGNSSRRLDGEPVGDQSASRISDQENQCQGVEFPAPVAEVSRKTRTPLREIVCQEDKSPDSGQKVVKYNPKLDTGLEVNSFRQARILVQNIGLPDRGEVYDFSGVYIKDSGSRFSLEDLVELGLSSLNKSVPSTDRSAKNSLANSQTPPCSSTSSANRSQKTASSASSTVTKDSQQSETPCSSLQATRKSGRNDQRKSSRLSAIDTAQNCAGQPTAGNVLDKTVAPDQTVDTSCPIEAASEAPLAGRRSQSTVSQPGVQKSPEPVMPSGSSRRSNRAPAESLMANRRSQKRKSSPSPGEQAAGSSKRSRLSEARNANVPELKESGSGQLNNQRRSRSRDSRISSGISSEARAHSPAALQATVTTNSVRRSGISRGSPQNARALSLSAVGQPKVQASENRSKSTGRALTAKRSEQESRSLSDIGLAEESSHQAEEDGRRGRRAASKISFKEPSLRAKMRQGDAGSSTIYGGLKPSKSKKSKKSK